MAFTRRDLQYTGALTLALSGVLLGGCTQTTEAPTTTAATPMEAVPPPAAAIPPAPAGAEGVAGANNAGTMPPGPAAGGGAPPMAGAGNAPFAGGMGGNASAPLTATPELDKKISDAEKGKDKKVIAAAYTERGKFRLQDDPAGAKVKYRAALEDFRKALAADPANKDAKASKNTIESIYKSMGRPIPQ